MNISGTSRRNSSTSGHEINLKENQNEEKKYFESNSGNNDEKTGSYLDNNLKNKFEELENKPIETAKTKLNDIKNKLPKDSPYYKVLENAIKNCNGTLELKNPDDATEEMKKFIENVNVLLNPESKDDNKKNASDNMTNFVNNYNSIIRQIDALKVAKTRLSRNWFAGGRSEKKAIIDYMIAMLEYKIGIRTTEPKINDNTLGGFNTAINKYDIYNSNQVYATIITFSINNILQKTRGGDGGLSENTSSYTAYKKYLDKNKLTTISNSKEIKVKNLFENFSIIPSYSNYSKIIKAYQGITENSTIKDIENITTNLKCTYQNNSDFIDMVHNYITKPNFTIDFIESKNALNTFIKNYYNINAQIYVLSKEYAKLMEHNIWLLDSAVEKARKCKYKINLLQQLTFDGVLKHKIEEEEDDILNMLGTHRLTPRFLSGPTKSEKAYLLGKIEYNKRIKK